MDGLNIIPKRTPFKYLPEYPLSRTLYFQFVENVNEFRT